MGAFYHVLYYYIRRDVLHGLFDYMSELFHFNTNTGLEEKDMKPWIKLMSKVLLLWATTLMLAFFVALWPLAVKDRYLCNFFTNKVRNNMHLNSICRKMCL